MSIKYSVDDFMKYTSFDFSLPSSLEKYKHNSGDFWKKFHVNCLTNPDVKSYINLTINKKNNDSNDGHLYDKIQNMLNKLSSNNFNDIGNEIKKLPYVKRKHIFKLCEFIIIKSINEPHFCEMYAALSNQLKQYYITQNQNQNDRVYFKMSLVTICQDMFEILASDTVIGKTFDYDRSTDYSKLKISGLMRFLGELYVKELFNDNVILSCFNALYLRTLEGSEDYYDALSVFVGVISIRLKKSNKDMYSRFKIHLSNLLDKNIIEFDNKKYDFKTPKMMHKFKIEETLKKL